MKRYLGFLLIFWLGASLAASAQVDLTGVWTAHDGSTYYVRHIGNQVYWRGVSKDQGRSWTHNFQGTLSGAVVSGILTDTPPGRTRNQQRLKLQVRNANRMEAISVDGKPRQKVWTRDGVRPPPSGNRVNPTGDHIIRRVWMSKPIYRVSETVVIRYSGMPTTLGAFITIVPAGSGKWYWKYKTLRERDGAMQFTGLKPGDYEVFAYPTHESYEKIGASRFRVTP